MTLAFTTHPWAALTGAPKYDIPTVLRSAAQFVRRGWCQGLAFKLEAQDGLHNAVLGLRSDVRVCALGAIDLASGYDIDGLEGDFPTRCFASSALSRAINGDHGIDGIGDWCIGDWNDAEGQTAENVAGALEYAAVLAEQRQRELDRIESEPVMFA
jgi:hypothetical protein